MKRMLCIALVAMMLVPGALAEPAKELPQPDEKGRTTYSGEIGWLFDEKGNFIKESLFDEAVLWIEEIPGVYDACIVVETGKYYDTINIIIMASPTPSKTEAKELADSAVRNVGNLFSMMDGYKGPSKNYFGSIFDEYALLVGVYSLSKNQIVLGAAAKGTQRLTW